MSIKKDYTEGTELIYVINNIASYLADGENATFTFFIPSKDYYFGYISKYNSTIFGGHFVSLGGVNYKFTSGIGVVQI